MVVSNAPPYGIGPSTEMFFEQLVPVLPIPVPAGNA